MNRTSLIDPPRRATVATGQNAPAVRQATAADVPGLARALAGAFHDDPVAAHCFPGDSRRTVRLARGFELFLRRVYLRHGQCFTTADLTGGALWLPPGEWKLDRLETLRLLPRMARVYGRDLRRLLGALDFLEHRHPEDPHHYLPFLGVEPARQGQGLGSALMRPVLERCDRDGVAAYLEASTERNRALYERHGFELVERVELPGGGPPMWRMWREPAGRTPRS